MGRKRYARWTEADIAELSRQLHAGKSASQIAREYGVTISAINHVIYEHNLKSLKNRKWGPNEEEQLVIDYRSTMPIWDIMRRYGLSRENIYQRIYKIARKRGEKIRRGKRSGRRSV